MKYFVNIVFFTLILAVFVLNKSAAHKEVHLMEYLKLVDTESNEKDESFDVTDEDSISLDREKRHVGITCSMGDEAGCANRCIHMKRSGGYCREGKHCICL